MRAKLRRAMRPFAARAARRAGLDVIARDFSSPVPDTSAIDEAYWDRRSPTPGLTIDTAAHIAFCERELGAHIAEFDPPDDPVPGGGFHLRNGWYESVDAEVLHAMVRRFRPARVIELGSGWSTLVISGALEANAAEGSPAEYRVHDPGWGDPVRADLPQLTSIDRVPGQDVAEQELLSLAAGDILFVDTSHVVKLGSEVNRVILEILPRLAAGVLVHFHDVWLPYEYHRFLFEGMGLAWNEQYLLHAYLAENEHWEVVFAAQAVARERDEELRRLVPSYDGTTYPSALWMRRR